MKMPPYLIVTLLTVAGCASGGEIQGVKTAADTSGLMLTARSVDKVAQCLAATLGSAARPEGSGFTVTAAGSSAPVYHVRPFDDQLHRYATVVEISGWAESPVVVVTCLPDIRT